MRASSSSSPRRRRSASAAPSRSTTAARGRARLRLRPGGADRRDHPRCADAEEHRGAVPRPGGACRDVPGGGPLGDRRRQPARSPTCAWGGSTTARVPTWARSRAASPRNIVPEWCTIHAEARSRDPVVVAELVQEMVDAIAFAASTSDCTVETEIEHTYARLHVLARRGGRRARCGRAATRGPASRRPPSRAAAPTPTSSTSEGCRVSTLPTGWSTFTQPTSASRSGTSRRWWT